MTTIRQQVRDAAIDAINVDRDPDIPEATKRRWVPGESAQCPMISVFFVEEPATGIGGRHGGLVERALRIAVQSIAAGELPEFSDDLVEPMLAHVVSRLGNTNLGGLALDIVELSTKWESATADRHYVAATQIWSINYQTKRHDLSARQ
jgi:hypothetical protein